MHFTHGMYDSPLNYRSLYVQLQFERGVNSNLMKLRNNMT